MRNLFAIFILVFAVPFFCRGQEKTVGLVATGITTEASIYSHTVRVQLEPFLSWGNQKNQLVVGPTIIVASNMGFQSSQMPKLSGMKIGYRLWPGSTNKQWNFYLSNDLRIQRVQDGWKGNAFNEELAQYEETDYRVIEMLVDNHLGYGVTFSIGQNLTLNQGVGLGAYISSLNGNDARAHETNFDYRGYKNFGFSWKVNIGIAYKL